MRVLTRFLLVFACMTCAASGAEAAMRDAALEISLFTGSYDLREDDTDSNSRSNVSGFRLGFVITEEHEVEFVYDSVDFEFAGLKLEEISSWSLRYLFNWNVGPRGRVVPYAGAGIGQVEDEVFDVPVDPSDPFSQLIDFKDDDTQVTFFAGLRVFAGRSFALRGEIDYKLFSTFDVDQTVFEVTAGLSWIIGGR